MKAVWRLLAAACALALGTAGGGCQKVRGAPETVTLQIAGEHFTLELALDDASRTTGLMGRREIPADGGMLFVFREPAVRSFWMAYCLVDIDLIFLDPNGRVTATHRMKVEPPRRDDESDPVYQARLASYPSVYPAQFAIELRQGTLERLDLRFESKIDMNLRRLKASAR